MHELRHVLGLDDPAGFWYLLWSGVGGANWPILGVGIVWWRHHTCHERGCHRLGHLHDGQPVCRVHHPKGKP